MCWHLLHIIQSDPYAPAQAIMSEWQLSFLTCSWRGCWNQRSAVTGQRLHVFILNPHEENNKWFELQYGLMLKMFDKQTGFRSSRQGNLLIQSRYVLWLSKTLATVFPEVSRGRYVGLRIDSHVHLQSMDKITRTTCNIMQYCKLWPQT